MQVTNALLQLLDVTFGSTRLRVLQDQVALVVVDRRIGYIWFDPSEGTARSKEFRPLSELSGYIWFDPSEGTARTQIQNRAECLYRVTFGSTRLRVLQVALVSLR